MINIDVNTLLCLDSYILVSKWLSDHLDDISVLYMIDYIIEVLILSILNIVILINIDIPPAKYNSWIIYAQLVNIKN